MSLLRTFAGAAFLGAVTDAMLLGHWYLVQPGLPRRHLNELVAAVGWVWPVEVVALLLPTGMFSVWTGAVDDGWNGMLGWFWAACAVTTIVLVFVTKAALARALVLGGDGGDRAAVPGHSHRLRHRPRRPCRARRLIRPGQTASFGADLCGMPRPVWSGTISFGLVAIPIKLFHAVQQARACRSTSSTSAR